MKSAYNGRLFSFRWPARLVYTRGHWQVPDFADYSVLSREMERGGGDHLKASRAGCLTQPVIQAYGGSGDWLGFLKLFSR